MKKRLLCLFCVLLLCFLQVCAFAEAKVHFNETPPDDWQERDLLRLIVFKTVVNDAMLLQCGGDTMLVDGAMDKWANLLMDAFVELGLTADDGHVHIPHVFNTHPHEDHLKGIYRLIRKGMTTDEFITSFPEMYRNSMLRTALKEFKSRDIPIHRLQQNEEMNLGGATLRFFWWADGGGPNELSCLTHVTFGDATLLLTADAESIAQMGVLNQVPKEWLQADILKFPHHAYTIMEIDFLETVNPQLVFATNWLSSIQPAAKQVERRNMIFVSQGFGRIVMETDGKEWYVTQNLGQF
ncbi:MAG: hypothetical protein IKH57_02035 [Clostridia bacterium]|nr:hypothetical protein [Clostridia bacterium]